MPLTGSLYYTINRHVMKKLVSSLRDTFFAGVLFLLPILIVIVLLTKVFVALTGFTTKIAAMFGLKSFVGISGGTIVSTVMIILLCLLCGYLVRIALFKKASNWMDNKLMQLIPGYKAYREMALSKLEPQEEVLPYHSAAWFNAGGMLQPAFIMETLADGRMVLFVPTAGNIREGIVCVADASHVQLCPDADMKALRLAVANLGIGLGAVKMK